MAKIVLLNPIFEPSYWGRDYAMPIFGKKTIVPPAALPLLAALTPCHHTLSIIDENIEAINFDMLVNADIVGLTGMSVQRFRMKEILSELKKRSVFTVVGGAWVTVEEDYFRGLADVIFVGESENTWAAFLNDWEKKEWRPRYEAAHKTDMTMVPTPRFDLLKMNKYVYGSIQISRGCPFTCEFCDIIVTFGRLPRLKSSHQVILELEGLRTQQVKHVFIVDDNLIGNKIAIKQVLRDIIDYQNIHSYPFHFLTEATLDLAEDDEMMQLMVAANIVVVFIGIESPNEESLRETKKHQNLRLEHGSMLDRLSKIQQEGLEVSCGMIVGFDHDDVSIFARQEEFIKKASIVHVMLGMLYAIPKTPLYARLEKEGRIDKRDKSEYGTNVMPLKLSREQLKNGYIAVTSAFMQVENYFDRVDSLYLFGKVQRHKLGQLKFLTRHPFLSLAFKLRTATQCIVIFLRLMHVVKDESLRRQYRRKLFMVLTHTGDVSLLLLYLVKCALHYHDHKLAEGMSAGRLVSTF